MTDLGGRYRRPEGVLHAELDGEDVLLNADTGMYHLVNRTGLFLLDRMDRGDTLNDAIRALSEETGTDLQRVSQDALSFVGAMTARGLLERASR